MKNELMTGDWMQHANGKYYQVTHIDKLHDGSINFACGVPYLWSYNNKFEPVPMTMEFLEGNGFTDCATSIVLSEMGLRYWYQGYGNYISDSDFLITQDTNKKVFFVRYASFSFPPIKYVHELQHILSICHIDKEIQLNYEEVVSADNC